MLKTYHPALFVLDNQGGVICEQSKRRKVKLCSKSSDYGFLIRPHRSPNAFCKGQYTVKLYQLERVLLYVNICLTLAVYGMKIPVHDIRAGFCRYDIGHNVNAINIPIFLQ